MQEWDECFASKFMNQFGFPKEHDVFLHRYRFFLKPQIVRKAHNLRMQNFEYQVLTTFAAKNSPVFRFSTIAN